MGGSRQPTLDLSERTTKPRQGSGRAVPAGLNISNNALLLRDRFSISRRAHNLRFILAWTGDRHHTEVRVGAYVKGSTAGFAWFNARS